MELQELMSQLDGEGKNYAFSFLSPLSGAVLRDLVDP